jgi:hypothetical protein
MPRPMPHLVVLDLSGMTMQDDGAVASIFQRVLADQGLASSQEEIAQVRGASKREAFQRLTGDPERAERLFEAFVASIRGGTDGSPRLGARILRCHRVRG